MEIQKINIKLGNLKEELMPLLLGKVFHVTKENSFKRILKSGSVNSNIEGFYDVNFPQSNKNYGARKGMVCLVDLRNKNFLEAVEHTSDGYYFLRPINSWKTVVFLILNSNYYNDLKLQARYNPPMVGENYIPMEDIYTGTYVPTECWYPKNIELNKISETLIINIK